MMMRMRDEHRWSAEWRLDAMRSGLRTEADDAPAGETLAATLGTNLDFGDAGEV